MNPQWECLEVLQRVSIRLSLGVPSLSSCTATLVEAQEMPFHLHSLQRAYRHLERLCRTPSIETLRLRILSRQNSRMGSLAQQFLEYIGPSGDLPVFNPPHEARALLKLFACVPDLESHSDVPPPVSRQLAEEHLATNFNDHIHVFTGGSVSPAYGTATVAYVCPSLILKELHASVFRLLLHQWSFVIFRLPYNV